MGGSGSPPAIKAGDVVLERYRVVEQIAAGGHSVVFRGDDERLSRPVCIKVFSGLGGESGVGRTSLEHFVQEAFALSRLTHPNTLRIYDFGHLGSKDAVGMPLQVCEYMNGGTLSNIIRERGRQSLAETTSVIVAMCAALGEAHGLGIVHRDIKPQNILFGEVGGTKLPKLADFGIAKWSSDPDEQKNKKRAEDTAIVAGQKLAMYSPSWAAPEQLAGQPVSPATDIYSLAAVAVYMMSTKAVFADEDVYAGYKKRRHPEDLVRDALTLHNIPRRAIDALCKALAFDPKKRLGRIDELASDLTAALEISTDEQPKLVTEATAALPAITTVETPAAKAAVRGVPPATPPPRPVTAPQQAADRENTPPAVASAVAPTPPAVPAPSAASWKPPQIVQPWMLSLPPATGASHRILLSDTPAHIANRRVHFVLVPSGIADIVGPSGSRLRVTVFSGPTGRVVHLKGMSCFVAPLGGRPSPAMNLDRSMDVALVTPRAQEIGHIRVANGSPSGAETVFPLGTGLVGVALDDCTDPILFDFGPGSDAYFIYTRGRTVPTTVAPPKRR